MYKLNLSLTKLFKNEDGRFFIGCGLKLAFVFMLTMLFVAYHLWVTLSLNSLFFESVGFFKSEALREAFFDHSLVAFFDLLPLIFIFFILLFFLGMYVGKILLRPFKLIATYAEDCVDSKDVQYNPDLFSDYRLLARFSELFFQYTTLCCDEGKMVKTTIPAYYSRIHKPIFEKVFFFHFLLIILIIGALSTFFCAYVSMEIQARIVELSIKTLSKNSDVVAYFLNNQAYIFDSLLWSSAFVTFISYLSLSFHFYGKVSGAIFAFFSTMRAIMKGNLKARVHLIGYAHIRPYGRMFNKFVDHTLNEIHNNKDQSK